MSVVRRSENDAIDLRELTACNLGKSKGACDIVESRGCKDALDLDS